jgi:hypothetical protein
MNSDVEKSCPAVAKLTKKQLENFRKLRYARAMLDLNVQAFQTSAKNAARVSIQPRMKAKPCQFARCAVYRLAIFMVTPSARVVLKIMSQKVLMVTMNSVSKFARESSL